MSDELPTRVGHTAGINLDLNLVGQTPHVFAYRVWAQQPGETDWILIHEGHTSDDKPEHKQVGPFPDGTKIITWVSAGGTVPTFKYLLTYAQRGAMLPGGTIPRQGRIAPGEKVRATKTTVELV
jgi:hypothetical protein